MLNASTDSERLAAEVQALAALHQCGRAIREADCPLQESPFVTDGFKQDSASDWLLLADQTPSGQWCSFPSPAAAVSTALFCLRQLRPAILRPPVKRQSVDSLRSFIRRMPPSRAAVLGHFCCLMEVAYRKSQVVTSAQQMLTVMQEPLVHTSASLRPRCRQRLFEIIELLVLRCDRIFVGQQLACEYCWPAKFYFGIELSQQYRLTGCLVPPLLQHCVVYLRRLGHVKGIFLQDGDSGQLLALKQAFDTRGSLCIDEILQGGDEETNGRTVGQLLSDYISQLPSPLCSIPNKKSFSIHDMPANNIPAILAITRMWREFAWTYELMKKFTSLLFGPISDADRTKANNFVKQNC